MLQKRAYFFDCLLNFFKRCSNANKILNLKKCIRFKFSGKTKRKNELVRQIMSPNCLNNFFVWIIHNFLISFAENDSSNWIGWFLLSTTSTVPKWTQLILCIKFKYLWMKFRRFIWKKWISPNEIIREKKPTSHYWRVSHFHQQL